MKINNTAFGGFVVSENIIKVIPSGTLSEKKVK